MSKRVGFLQRLAKQKLIVVIFLPLLVLAVSLLGIYYLNKLATMQMLERDHIELAWKNKYYINVYTQTGSEEAYQEFIKGQKEMLNKPETFMQMITPLDKMVLSSDMNKGIEMCYKDIDALQAWGEALEQFRIGQISKDTFLAAENKAFEEVKKNSDDFHILFTQVQAKVQWIILSLVVLANLLLIFMLYRIVWPMRKGIEHLTENINRLADGNLVIDKRKSVNNEVGVLMDTFNHAVEKFRDLVNQIQECTAKVDVASTTFQEVVEQSAAAGEQVAATMQGITQATDKQVQNVQSAKNTVQAMQSRFQKVDKGIEVISNSATEMQKTTEMGREFFSQNMSAQMDKIRDEVSDTVQKVKDLGEKSQAIGQFVSVITGLADQTNLLALNAAIEAARAGEQGRGFAVVAEEVRKLAEQSAQAAQEISTLIQVIQKDTDMTVTAIQRNTVEVNKGSELAQEVGQGFERLRTSANEVVHRIGEVSTIYEELNYSIDEVLKSIDEVEQHAEQIAAGSEEVAASTEEQAGALGEMNQATNGLGDITSHLKTLLNQFRV